MLEVGAALVSLTTPLFLREESPRRVMLLRVKEGKSKLTLSATATSHNNNVKMKKKKKVKSMAMNDVAPRINKKMKRSGCCVYCMWRYLYFAFF